jgi:hypothetical protein
MPEFGYLDGAEWTQRRDNGHRYGFSAGFLPELDDDFDTGRDLQIAGFYEFVSDPGERFTLAAGFQKTWHNSNADRDLVIVRTRYLPDSGWDLSGTAWIDVYTSGDAGKPFLEITHVYATARKTYAGGNGVVFAYRHQAYPQIDRVEFLPVLANEIANNRYDRLSVDAWRYLTDHLRVRGFVAGLNDEEFTGGAAELSLQTQDLLAPNNRADITAFIDRGQFATTIGGRASYARYLTKGRFEVLYEVANHHQFDFADNVNDIVQHRARVTGAYYVGKDWDVSGYVEIQLYDEEFSWSFGFTVQKQF